MHEAMQQVETADVPPNQVISEMVRGYSLNDRLIRPALVCVAKAPAARGDAGVEPQGSPAGAPAKTAEPEQNA
jgi:molecular chaperone GrpE